MYNAILSHVAPSSLIIVRCWGNGDWVEYVGTVDAVETAKKNHETVIKCDPDAVLWCGVYLIVSPGDKALDVAWQLVKKGGAYNATVKNPRVWSGGMWRLPTLAFWQGR